MPDNVWRCFQAGLRAVHQAALEGHGPVIAALIQNGELVDTTCRVRSLPAG